MGDQVTKNTKWTVLGGIVVAVIGAAALIISNWDHGRSIFAPDKRTISGTVLDEKTKAGIAGAIVQLQSIDGKAIRQDTTSTSGKYSLDIPGGFTDIRLAATADGYVPYDEKIPAASSKNDIPLHQRSITFGVSEGTSLEQALKIVSAKLNITVVFGNACSKKARNATLSGAELEATPAEPETVLQSMLSHVNGATQNYRVTTLDPRRRYVVSCF